MEKKRSLTHPGKSRKLLLVRNSDVWAKKGFRTSLTDKKKETNESWKLKCGRTNKYAYYLIYEVRSEHKVCFWAKEIGLEHWDKT